MAHRLIKGTHMTPAEALRRVYAGACDLEDVLWRWATRLVIPVLEVRACASSCRLAHASCAAELVGAAPPLWLCQFASEQGSWDQLSTHSLSRSCVVRVTGPVLAPARRHEVVALPPALMLQHADAELACPRSAQALEALHNRGIVHLDFKASNCLFSFPSATAPPVVRLIDLGFAAGFKPGAPRRTDHMCGYTASWECAHAQLL